MRHPQDFEQWKASLSQDRSLLELRDSEPLERLFQKMVSISELLEGVERRTEEGFGRFGGRVLKLEDLDS